MRLEVSKQVVKSIKTVRTVYKSKSDIERVRDFVFDDSGFPLPTKRELSNTFDSIKDIVDDIAQDAPGLVSSMEAEFGNRELTEKQREAVSAIVNASDRLQDEADDNEELRDVYTGEKEPLDAIVSSPGLTRRVARACAAGYREFVVDDETSTCVFDSLVEENCYAGSRRVSEVDLGESEACLYYSLDFFQPDGSCRQNYRRVYFNGRWTCRWEALGVDKAPWYTLHKALDEEPSPPDPSPPDPSPPDPSPPDPSPPDPSPPDPSPPDPSPPEPEPA